MRVTRTFLNTIRKQFLVWRTFSPQTKQAYEAQGAALVAAAEVNV